MKEIALSNPGARQILEDAGIDYCCGGGKSLQDACLKANVAESEILWRPRQNSEVAELWAGKMLGLRVLIQPGFWAGCTREVFGQLGVRGWFTCSVSDTCDRLAVTEARRSD